ncbi:MAG: hypothetical protein H7Z72_10605 [Bacteroidetes bacterium]|nr:hypothetical protein [Fibrella sp.]
MKNACLLLFATGLLLACGRTEKTQDNAQSAPADSVTTAAKLRNCQSIADAEKLGKPMEYRESAKPITFTLTLDQDTSATQTAGGCYLNNTITVMAVRKSGKQLFKRTLTKDDLRLFAKDDETVGQTVLQSATYKPTFNGERYLLVTMRMLEPDSKKTRDYTLFMNYYGEIVKLR